MFKVIHRIFKSNSTPNNQHINEKTPLRTNLQENIRTIIELVGNSPDVVIRKFGIGKKRKIKIALVYTEGLADTKSVNQFIMESLMMDIQEVELNLDNSSIPYTFQLLKELLPVGSIKEVSDFETLLPSILSGDAAILLEGNSQGLLVGLKGSEDRGVQEPSSQTVIRGPKEGFSENIRTNTALVRRKIRDPNLWMENLTIGRVTKTAVNIMYIQGIANGKVVEEVRKRLTRIEIDSILEGGYIEELIQDETYTVFPTVFNTERPDVIAAGLLEGRIAIFVDGTPFVLLVPVIFTQFFSAAEDYYQRSDIATLLRLLRYLSLFIALLGPSLYIAITTFHQEMLPPGLLFSLMAQREGVPFPVFIEALLMEVTFELLREAGVRMPRAVGQSVSIVGALVIGQAAVEAGIISASMVIVVSITAISSFIIPAYNLAISVRILRFGMMGLAASFGLLGIIVGIIAVIQHLCQLRSFGVPYMAPFGPMVMSDQKDAIFRAPWWGMFSRPRFMSQKNISREDNPPTPQPRRKV
ncbi:spore germination protein [Bacillus sp. ISL-46]|uniref:spore germination protein n=1 Tax=Bacillus sp. ISL-46 TaxID=2819129 RepID=UPI001BE8AD3D|nr:spore germination protein [Bacillus sp. ISL-46]MBT2725101.1 spore germination protein [Bacillus sp. ISL-46]